MSSATTAMPRADGVFWKQVKALVKKDFIVMLQYRRAFLWELVFPLLMGTLACLFLSLFLNMSAQTRRGYLPYGCNGVGFSSYAPYNMTGADLMCQWNNPIGYCGYGNNCQGYPNESALFDAYGAYVKQQEQYRYPYLGAIFYSQNFSAPKNPVDVITVQQFQVSQCVPIGQAVFKLFNDLDNIAVNFKAFTSSMVQQFNIRQQFATGGAIMLSMAFLPMTSTMAGRLVDEKRAKVREHLRVMGVTTFAYLLAAFAVALIRVSFVSTSMLILIGAFNIVNISSLFGVWFSLVCYGFSLAGFAQIMPAFFSRPTMSNAAVSLFISLTSVGAVFASQIPQLTPLLGFFFSPAAFVYNAAQLLNNNFANLTLTPGAGIACLLWQMIMYAAISQYLYNINPGEFGVPRPLLFPIYDLRDFICGSKNQQLPNKLLSEETSLLGNEATSPTNGKGGASYVDRIVLEKLVKVFGNETEQPAVNQLSMRVREKEIFALLGHNGAGKTTTISMLIGMLPSTSYETASVLGFDLNTELHQIRHYIGICPQFDVLFDDLSGRQHLELYAAVKGKAVANVDEMLQRLKLPTDDQKASTYSGGMKRRLSVGNALVGDAPIIFLDEPSSGLDPLSRRQLWELLREERNRGKTIVLTTHFMEEADYLGDRIAIMSHGKMYCCDTSANLKAKYGVGYYLTFAKKTASPAHGGGQQHHREDAVDPFRKDVVSQILDRFIASNDWSVSHESIGDVTFLLAPAALPAFGTLLHEIETNLDAIGAVSYGLAMNTLEDVFVNISEREAAAVAHAHNTQPVNSALLDTTLLSDGTPVEELFAAAAGDDCLRILSQIFTVFSKRRMTFTRSARSILLSVVVPLLMVGIGFGAVIPNFMNGSNGGGNYNYNSWASYYDGQQWPNEVNPNTVVVFQDSDTWTAAIDDVLDTFSDLYVEYEAARGNSGASFAFEKVTANNFALGAFLGGGSISFLSNFNPVLQMRIADNFVHEFLSPISPNATVSFFFNDQNFAGPWMIIVTELMQAAIEIVWRKNNRGVGNFSDVVFPMGVPVPFNPTVNMSLAPTPAPTTPVPTPAPTSGSGSGSDYQPEFILVPLAILLNVCVGQIMSSIALPLADELNRKVYQTLRLHGLSAFAYWMGNYLFDMTVTFGSLLFAYIVGCYARGVTQIQNDLIAFQLLVLFFALSSAILMSYVIIVVLPENLKPSTYIYAASGAYYLTLVIPMVIYMGMMFSNSQQVTPTWVEVVTPSRALLTAVMSDVHPASDVWGKHRTIATWISLGAWNFLWLLVLLYQAYISPRFSLAEWLCYGKRHGNDHRARGNSSLDMSSVPQFNQPQMGAIAPSNGINAPPPTAGIVTGTVVEDPDVTDETRRVETAPGDNMAVTYHLRKVYHGVSRVGSANREQSAIGNAFAAERDKVAVRDLTLGIRSGECFGLLGPNGAGKTTTVKMLMRELAPTQGSVLFPYAPQASDVSSGPLGSLDHAFRHTRLGACQQGDTLIEQFTAEEHVRLYLKIRLGARYSASQWTKYVENTIHKVGLEEAGTKRAGQYSGGMKRKLAVAVAMYTGAVTVFLDEPSTGMDPYARRALWRSIHEALRHDRCVLLTTHSMEEADAVCARIGIVTGGVLQCIGNAQRLKNRFGSGYSVTVTLHPRDANGQPVITDLSQTDEEAALKQLAIESTQAVQQTEAAARDIDNAMREIFGKDDTCELKEVLGLQRRYAVTKLPALSYAFRSLQDRKVPLGIASYSVQQLTSLEQIFINFAGSAANEGN